MAITFVGGTTQDSGGALSLTLPIDGAAQADDFLIAFVKQSENTARRTWDNDGGGGNGWTRLAYNRTTGGRDQETAIYYKIHSGTENNPTFTWNTSGTNEPMSGSLLVYRGVDTAEPIADFGYASAQNDANPRNPPVEVSESPATILTFHAATHDDISSPAAPTGYTMRTQVWAGASNDHRNHFTADLIGLGVLGVYTPPDWQHTILNNTPEYHTYTVALQEQRFVGVDLFNGTGKFLWSDTGLVVEGFGFEAAQGSGVLEIWDDLAGTTREAQAIVSWSDTSITIDPVQGALPNGAQVYVVVTNDSGDVSSSFPVSVGVFSYSTVISGMSPDHYWPLDNTYDDNGSTGPIRNMTTDISGGGGAFVAAPISEDAAFTWRLSGLTQRRGCADSVNMNITNALQQRTMGGWVQFAGIQQSLSAIYKEGGAVNNLAFTCGVGNVVTAALADTGDDNVQAFSDSRFRPGRPQHIMLRYDYNTVPREFSFWVDGRKQSVTSGNPLTSAGNHLDQHSGDINWGDPDSNLETGGTDIGYSGQQACDYQHWATWSENSANTGALSEAEILELFQRGAVPADVITSDTQANMQVDLDATVGERADWPLSYRIEAPSGGGDLVLDMTDKVFDALITEHLEWRGSGTLTINMRGTTNFDAAKTFSPVSGIVLAVQIPTLVITGLEADTEVRVYEAGTTIEVSGQELVNDGEFRAEIEVASVDVVIHALGYLNRRIEGVDMTGGNVTLPVKQRLDRQYENA